MAEDQKYHIKSLTESKQKKARNLMEQINQDLSKNTKKFLKMEDH